MYDFLIVGSGLFGSVFAREAAERNKKVLIIEKRDHIGGNCFTEKKEGINVHVYGPHLFHCNSEIIWNYVNRFTKFKQYQHKVKVNFKDEIYSFPLNLTTLNKVWGIKTPYEAVDKLQKLRMPFSNDENLENWALSQIGEELYSIFIEGYTTKQWGKHPSLLPSSIIKRIPIRLTYDDRYFNDDYQGIPEDGYTNLFKSLLDHKNISFETQIDYLERRDSWDMKASHVVYTGKIDEFFRYKFGSLNYRSLKFESKVVKGDFQGCSIMNYTDIDVPYTRIVEHKHFEHKISDKSVVTYEYPKMYDRSNEPFYPINNEENNDLYKKYKSLIDKKYIFGGRLAEYQYYDMHQVIGSALSKTKKLFS